MIQLYRLQYAEQHMSIYILMSKYYSREKGNAFYDVDIHIFINEASSYNQFIILGKFWKNRYNIIMLLYLV